MKFQNELRNGLKNIRWGDQTFPLGRISLGLLNRGVMWSDYKMYKYLQYEYVQTGILCISPADRNRFFSISDTLLKLINYSWTQLPIRLLDWGHVYRVLYSVKHSISCFHLTFDWRGKFM